MRLSGTKTNSINQYRGLGNQLWDLSGNRPSLDLRFADNKSLVDATTGQNLVTFTRASSGTYVGSDGLIKTATTNLQVFSDQFDNAYWTKGGLLAFGSGSITNAIAAPDGTLTADKIVEDTSTGNHRIFAGPSGLVAGNAYTGSIFVKAAERTEVSIELRAASTVGSYIVNLSTGSVISGAPSGQTIQIINAGNGWWRICITQSSATSTSGPGLLLIAMRSGGNTSYTGDGTSGIYLWGAQFEQSSTVGEYIPTTSTINSAPRFDHSLTSSRTNHIRNNTMVGAVAGTPGTAPTYWSFPASQSGLAVNVVGTGVENGINYVDFRFFGTTTSALFGNVAFEPNTSVAATQNSIWTHSAYLKLAGGSTTNVNAIRLVIDNYNSSGISLTQYAVSLVLTPSANSLDSQRFRASSTGSTFSNAATAFVRPYVQIEAASGVAIDITLRIGMPQLEQGSVATTVIPTSTAAVTVNTTESLGLLVEEQRTNLLVRSEEFDNASWSLGAATVTPNAVAAPNGSLTADQLVETTATANHEASQSFTPAANTSYTLSCYLKAATSTACGLRFSAGLTGSGVICSVDLNAKTATVTSGTGTATIATLADGWFRVSLTATASASPSSTFAYVFRALGSAGSTSNSIYLWGAQLEAGAFPTSYIPTTTATVTRSADVASITGSSFSSWYRQDEGTVFVEAARQSTTGFPGRARFSDGTAANSIDLYYDAAANSSTYEIKASSTSSVQIYGGGGAVNSSVKAAAGWQTNSAAVMYNGSTQGTDSSVVVPVVDQLRIGNSLTGTVRRLTYWPRRLGNEVLQEVTR